jgi:hypothetical protein
VAGLRLKQCVTSQRGTPFADDGYRPDALSILCQKCFVRKFLHDFAGILSSGQRVGRATR